MTQHLIVPLVGAFYRPPAKAVLGLLPSGTALQLVPEPENEHDPDAIQVFVEPQVLDLDARQQLELHCQGYGVDMDLLLAQAIHLGYIARTGPKAPTGNRQVLEVLATGAIVKAELSFSAEGKPTVVLTWTDTEALSVPPYNPQPDAGDR